MKTHPRFTATLTSANHPVIMESLEQLAEDAVTFLSPYFGVNAPIPFTTLHYQTAFWHPGILQNGNPYPECVTFNLSHFDNPMAVGEEYGHYMHFVKNPKVRDGNDNSLEFLNLKEMIGYYSGLVYASVQHPILPKVKEAIGEAVKPILQTWEYWFIAGEITDGESRDLDRRIHDGGIRGAKYLYQLYGPDFLRELSDMDVPDVLSLLRKTGYTKKLAIID